MHMEELPEVSISHPKTMPVKPLAMIFFLFRHRIAISAAVILLPTIVVCSHGADEPTPVDRALELSGLAERIEALPEMLMDVMPAGAFPDRRSEIAARRSLRDAGKKHDYLSLVRTAVNENLDADKLDRIIAFYRTPLGRKAASRTDGALTPHAIREISEGRKVLRKLEPERRLPLERIATAENVERFNRALIGSAVRGFLEGAGNEQLSESDIERQTDELTAQAAGNPDRTRELALIYLARALRPLSNEELVRLADFLQSDAAQWFRASVRKGTHRAVRAVARDVGRAISEVRRDNDSESETSRNRGRSQR